ncbi:hypothetical protein Cflav_PD3314 [Pedosphaera parvula Ellin514]|uniref:TIR domain-containing protein n=1 Tax=Pedosphaera parvula (strain Ellin514) TaxID=320771 RepID=B9XI83_PEDPL|nr:hypothetical protein Cflav_PD3314 [Pedosphaera parvula Ellin514]
METLGATEHKFDVFLSHSSKDKPTVHPLLLNRYASFVIRVWFDVEESLGSLPAIW